MLYMLGLYVHNFIFCCPEYKIVDIQTQHIKQLRQPYLPMVNQIPKAFRIILTHCPEISLDIGELQHSDGQKPRCHPVQYGMYPVRSQDKPEYQGCQHYHQHTHQKKYGYYLIILCCVQIGDRKKQQDR